MRLWSASAAVMWSALVLGACGGGEVVVQAQLEGEGGEPHPIAELPVRALPYDRDAIFDSLRQVYADPEPAIPDTLLRLRDEISAAQQSWQQAETRWNTLRDSLRAIRARMDRIGNRASPEYRLLFADFNNLEPQERAAYRQNQAAFERFSQLQQRYTSQADEVRLRREAWGDQAYAAVDSVIEAKLEQLGREELVDTTDASGIARFEGTPGGEWWIHARYDLPYEELYWNVPVQVEGGDPVQVVLNRSTAQVRPKM